MSEHITFHLVSPERRLASIDTKSVVIPGVEGDITILPNHADFLTSLRPGILTVENSLGAQEYLVTGGFVEVSDSGVTVLAEKAALRDEVDENFVAHAIVEAEEEVSKASERQKASADLRLNDLRTLEELLS
jgi:F-type H+-transporting ATPase subunit epsilon